jgi:hypothetical protein
MDGVAGKELTLLPKIESPSHVGPASDNSCDERVQAPVGVSSVGLDGFEGGRGVVMAG